MKFFPLPDTSLKRQNSRNGQTLPPLTENNSKFERKKNLRPCSGQKIFWTRRPLTVHQVCKISSCRIQVVPSLPREREREKGLALITTGKQQ